jgi:hypothetical protein
MNRQFPIDARLRQIDQLLLKCHIFNRMGRLCKSLTSNHTNRRYVTAGLTE